jgi:hypothetical protein
MLFHPFAARSQTALKWPEHLLNSDSPLVLRSSNDAVFEPKKGAKERVKNPASSFTRVIAERICVL